MLRCRRPPREFPLLFYIKLVAFPDSYSPFLISHIKSLLRTANVKTQFSRSEVRLSFHIPRVPNRKGESNVNRGDKKLMTRSWRWQEGHTVKAKDEMKAKFELFKAAWNDWICNKKLFLKVTLVELDWGRHPPTPPLMHNSNCLLAAWVSKLAN